MAVDNFALKELELAIADKIFLQVASWNLYLGDAGLAKPLAIECMARLDNGISQAAEEALGAIEVSFAAGKTKLPLADLIPSSQVEELKELLNQI